jgi:hypothetical protein
LTFGLSNSGEKIRLFDNYGNIVDSLTYDDKSPWPNSADGEGFTLQLNNFEIDNAEASNWKTDTKYGTPGQYNIITEISSENEKLPKEYKLYQNYPNPFNNETIINVEVPKKSKVSLKIYDVLGREISTLLDETKEAGKYQILFNSSNLSNSLSSGVYFYRFGSRDFVITKKMILLK